jgi:mannan endo-1,4-beta-mannosidase
MAKVQMKNTRGLTNLIWVWSIKDVTTTLTSTLEYYPDDSYVDVVALDPWNYGFTTDDYSATLAIAKGKPIAIGETGKIPSPSVLAAQPCWTWFLGWAELVKLLNTPTEIRAVYNDPRVVTLCPFYSYLPLIMKQSIDGSP